MLNYLKEKHYSVYYKLLTIAVLFGSLLPEYLALVSVIVLAIYFLMEKKQRDAITAGRTAKVMAVYIIYMFLSAIWAQVKLASIASGVTWTCALLVFLLVASMSDSRDRLENIMLCFVGSAALNSIVAIIQMAFMAIGKSQYFPSPIYEKADTVIYNLMRYNVFFEDTIDRTSGCFNSPLVLATFLVMAFPLAAFCSFYATTKKRRTLSLVAGVFIFFGIMFTFLRGAAVAVVLSFMMLSFAGKKPAKFMSGAALVTAVILLAVLFERRGVATSDDLSTNYRFELWKICFKAFKENALLGLGAGSGNVNEYLLSKSIEFSHAHNLFVEVVTEGGIIGTVIFTAFVAVIITDVLYLCRSHGWYKRYAIAFVSSLVGFLSMSIFESTLSTVKEILYFAVLLGCIAAIKRACKRNKEKLAKKAETEAVKVGQTV